MDDSIGRLQAAALRFRDERDWAQFHRPKDLALGLLVEAGELAELFLWKDDAAVEAATNDAAFRARAAEELADVQVFLLYLSDRLGIALAPAVDAKLAANALKYPVERSKGHARKYTDL